VSEGAHRCEVGQRQASGGPFVDGKLGWPNFNAVVVVGAAVGKGCAAGGVDFAGFAVVMVHDAPCRRAAPLSRRLIWGVWFKTDKNRFAFWIPCAAVCAAQGGALRALAAFRQAQKTKTGDQHWQASGQRDGCNVDRREQVLAALNRANRAASAALFTQQE